MNEYKNITVGNATYIMDEGGALDLVRAMSREFHWAGTLWTTDDIRACILDKYADEDEVDELCDDAVWRGDCWCHTCKELAS